MADVDYIEGENVTYVYDGPTGSVDALGPAAQKLMEEDLDLIFSLTTPATLAAKQAVEGTDIPVVFVPVYDPVASGVVESLVRPGGNLTGVRGGGHLAKMLELLGRIAPTTTCFVPHNPADNSSVQGLAELRQAADALGVELVTPEVRTSEELTAALGAIPPEVDAMLVLPGGFFSVHMPQIGAASIERKLPLASGPIGPETRVLMTYGADIGLMGEQASLLAKKILDGGAPAELPVETADFLLGVNLQTAKAIGIEISDDILQQADTIIR